MPAAGILCSLPQTFATGARFMALDTLDHSPPPIFRQGLSSLSKLVLLGLLAILLMSVDKRLNISQPIRSTVSVLLTPLEWLSLQPGRAITAMGVLGDGAIIIGDNSGDPTTLAAFTEPP